MGLSPFLFCGISHSILAFDRRFNVDSNRSVSTRNCLPGQVGGASVLPVQQRSLSAGSRGSPSLLSVVQQSCSSQYVYYMAL